VSGTGSGGKRSMLGLTREREADASRSPSPVPAPVVLTVDRVIHDSLAQRIATVDSAKFGDSDALAQETCLTLIRAFGTLNAFLDEQLGQFELSRVRLHVLAFLNRAEADVRMTDIGAWLGVSKAHVTRLIDSLESNGLVERVSNRADRRATFVRISSPGRARLNAALPPHLAHMGRLLASLSEEEKLTLTHLLAKTREGLLQAMGKEPTAAPAFPV